MWLTVHDVAKVAIDDLFVFPAEEVLDGGSTEPYLACWRQDEDYCLRELRHEQIRPSLALGEVEDELSGSLVNLLSVQPERAVEIAKVLMLIGDGACASIRDFGPSS